MGEIQCRFAGLDARPIRYFPSFWNLMAAARHPSPIK